MIGSRQIHHEPIGPTEQFIDVVPFSRVSYDDFARLTPNIFQILLPTDRTRAFKITRYWCASIDTYFTIDITETPLVTATRIGGLLYDTTTDGKTVDIDFAIDEVVYLDYDRNSFLHSAIRFGIIYA